MNHSLKSESDVIESENISDGAVTPSVTSKTSNSGLAGIPRRLIAWIAARIKEHEDRMVSLRVYSQYRLDERATYGTREP